MLQLWHELANVQDSAILEERVADFNQKVNQLWEDLMRLEMQLVDQLEVRDNTKNSKMLGSLHSYFL